MFYVGTQMSLKPKGVPGPAQMAFTIEFVENGLKALTSRGTEKQWSRVGARCCVPGVVEAPLLVLGCGPRACVWDCFHCLCSWGEKGFSYPFLFKIFPPLSRCIPSSIYTPHVWFPSVISLKTLPNVLKAAHHPLSSHFLINAARRVGEKSLMRWQRPGVVHVSLVSLLGSSLGRGMARRTSGAPSQVLCYSVLLPILRPRRPPYSARPWQPCRLAPRPQCGRALLLSCGPDSETPALRLGPRPVGCLDVFTPHILYFHKKDFILFYIYIFMGR